MDFWVKEFTGEEGREWEKHRESETEREREREREREILESWRRDVLRLWGGGEATLAASA